MKRELRDRWIAALESGEYEKGKSFLRSPGGSFCCLGVLCDIENAWDPEPGVSGAYAISGKVHSLPAGAFGFTSWYAGPSQLATINDGSDTFEPVVAKIRELFPDEACS